MFQPNGNAPWIYDYHSDLQQHMGQGSVYVLKIDNIDKKKQRNDKRNKLHIRHKIKNQTNDFKELENMKFRNDSDKILFQLTTMQLLTRISNPRRKELGLLRKITELPPKIIAGLVRAACIRFEGKRKDTIFRKLEEYAKLKPWNRTNFKKRNTFAKQFEADTCSKLNLSIPYCKGTNVANAFMKFINKFSQYDDSITRQRFVLIKIKNQLCPTVKEFLNNETGKTEESLLLNNKVCGCNDIYDFFKKYESCNMPDKRLPDGVYVDPNNHLAVRLIETQFYKKMLKFNVSSHTRIIPEIEWLRKQLYFNTKKLSKVGGTILKPTINKAIKLCIDKITKAKGKIRNNERSGILAEDFNELKEKLDQNCIIAEIDKCKFDLSIRCVQGHSQLYKDQLNVLYKPLEPKEIKEMYLLINQIIDKSTKFNFKIPRKFIKLNNDPNYNLMQDWGILKLRLKTNAYNNKDQKVINKYRPLVSYYTHILRQLLRNCCRAGSFLVTKAGHSIGVIDIKTVQTNIGIFNDELKKDELNPENSDIIIQKYDVDNFYGNVDLDTVLLAFEYTVEMSIHFCNTLLKLNRHTM